MEDGDIKTIILGYDGSEGADRAARLTTTLARRFGASVVVVSCFKRHARVAELDEKANQEISHANELANRQVAQLVAMDIPAKAVVLSGPAALAMVTVADSRQADLIVVGSRGLNAASARLLGSTSEKVVRGAQTPVLVAR